MLQHKNQNIVKKKSRFLIRPPEKPRTSSKSNMANSSKRSLLIGGALLLGIIAFVALALRQDPVPNAQVQLSRIDFEAPLEKQEAQAVQRAVMNTAGVKHCYLNAEDGTLTFSYDLREQQNKIVLEAVQQATATNARLYQVLESAAASGCPVTGAGSPVKKVLAFAGQFWPF
jgi:hypothetical protein